MWFHSMMAGDHLQEDQPQDDDHAKAQNDSFRNVFHNSNLSEGK